MFVTMKTAALQHRVKNVSDSRTSVIIRPLTAASGFCTWIVCFKDKLTKEEKLPLFA